VQVLQVLQVLQVSQQVLQRWKQARSRSSSDGLQQQSLQESQQEP
jgi:hypothetical protein